MLFTFPSRYWFTIGLSGVFSLTGWSRQILTGFLVSRDTQDTARLGQKFVYGIITLFDESFQNSSTSLTSCHSAVLQPHYCRNKNGLGSSRFARHYSGNHYYFLFLWVLRCFSSPRLLTLRCDRIFFYRVAPFGDLRIEGYLHLPVAFRSLSRPSSPLRA